MRKVKKFMAFPENKPFELLCVSAADYEALEEELRMVRKQRDTQVANSTHSITVALLAIKEMDDDVATMQESSYAD